MVSRSDNSWKTTPTVGSLTQSFWFSSVQECKHERTQFGKQTSMIRLLSQTSYLSAQAIHRERIVRQSQHRRTSAWSRGDLVCYWRQPGTQHADIVNVGKSGFVGPAVVLGQDQGWKDGEVQARNRVWLLHGNRVVVVTPSHLRAATDTQKILHQVEGEDWPSLQHLFNQSGKRLSRSDIDKRSNSTGHRGSCR